MAGRQVGGQLTDQTSCCGNQGVSGGQVQGTRCAASPHQWLHLHLQIPGPAGDGLCRGAYLIATIWSVEAGRGEVLVGGR